MSKKLAQDFSYEDVRKPELRYIITKKSSTLVYRNSITKKEPIIRKILVLVHVEEVEREVIVLVIVSYLFLNYLYNSYFLTRDTNTLSLRTRKPTIDLKVILLDLYY
ncbi:hypothetical protein FB567DRAFT_551069 [Paraphoma chrysanthemicola]|uniref:Uncharacterized protein n=1 Tax=Paraphoma chrysanthemicola TaxID=798071 RepID=A0A8K0R1L0_9PLEO|nr:hypothetical protein FB567DRAFT_551069 [Paraphoma chrysanthemicola]